MSEAVLEAMGLSSRTSMRKAIRVNAITGGASLPMLLEPAHDRAKQLFGAEHANVQPHAGSQANMAAFAAVIRAGRYSTRIEFGAWRAFDARSSAEFFGKTYKIVPYGVTKETETIDYDELAADR